MISDKERLEYGEDRYQAGVAEGRAEGEIKLAKEKTENAKALLREGVSPEIIARALGLPLEKVESLREV